MLYFYALDVEIPGFEETIPVILNARTNDGLDAGPMELLRGPEILGTFKGTDEEISVAWLPDREYPLITCDYDSVNQEKVINVSDVWGLVSKAWEQNNGEIPKEIMSRMLDAVSQRYGKEEASQRIAMCIRELKYEGLTEDALAFPIKVGVMLYEDLAVMTNNRIEQHNAAFTGAAIIKPEDNVTLFQNECTDDLFIEIPDRNLLLLDETIKYSTIIPGRSSVCNPYSDVNAYSPKYANTVAKYLIPMIEGNSANNTLAIQENEQKYYDALCKWVEFNIKEDFGEGADGNVIDELSRSYLTELADRLYAWHWQHNKNIPVNFADEEDDSDSDDGFDSESDSGATSRYGYQYEEGEEFRINNGLLVLEQFLEDASSKLGYKVYVEAVIKLARWGTRKCTALVFDGLDVMFNLGDNTIKRNLGNISDYTVKVTDGKQHNMKGVITFRSKVADKSFGIEEFTVPVGLIVNTVMTKGEESIKIPQYVPFNDAVRMVKDGELSIAGVDYVDGKIVANCEIQHVLTIRDLIDDYSGDADSFLQNPFYRDKELVDLCLKFGTGKNVQNQNLIAMMNDAICDPMLQQEFTTFALSDMSDLKAKMLNGSINSVSDALIVNLASILMPVLLKAEKMWVESDKSVQSLFDIWSSVVGDGIDLNSFWRTASVEEEKQPEPEQEVKKESLGSEVQNMSTFENVQSATASATPAQPTQEAGGILLRSIKPGAVFTKLTDFTGERIGGYTKEICEENGKSVKKYIFVDNEYLNSVPVEQVGDGSVSILKVFPVLIQDLYAVSAGRPGAIKAYFVNNNSIIKYRDSIKDTMSQIEKFRAEHV